MQKYFYRFFWLITFALTFVRLSAVQPSYFMLGQDHFNGIHIYDIIQDKELNYWFATNEGLYIYDYQIYAKIECEKAKSEAMFGFTMNANGTIYCHNLNNQIFEIKNKSCRLFYELDEDEGRADISLAITNNQQLIIGAKKIIVLNQSGVPVLKYKLNGKFAGPAYTSQSGVVKYHLSATDSLLCYSNGKITSEKLTKNETKSGISNVLHFFRNHTKVYAADLRTQELFIYNEISQNLISVSNSNNFIPNGNIRIYETGNEVWAANSFNGIHLTTNPELNSETRKLYDNYYISSVYKDNEGNLFLSTFDHGVLVIPDLNVSGVINSFHNDPATSVFTVNATDILIGTSKGVLLKQNSNETTVLDKEGTHRIDAIYGNPLSPLIIYSNGKIKALNQNTGQLLHIPESSLKGVAFISPYQFYIGTNRGVFKTVWDAKKGIQITALTSLQQRVYSICYNAVENKLYTSTATGLFITDSLGQSVEVKWNDEGIFPTQVLYNNGRVYAPTRKNGILVIRNGKVERTIVPVIDGKSGILNKIHIKDNFIYASSAGGLYKFDINGVLITPIHIVYGFGANKTIDYTFNGDLLWVCHSGGLQPIDLNYISSKNERPSIRFNAVFNNDIPTDFNRSGNFESDERKIRFVFTSPTLRNRGIIRYHYKLSGYDTEWIVNDYNSNTATYNALAPGTYTMQIKAENQGRFSKTVSYTFTIASPFYTRWWFICGCVALFLAIVYSIYKWQLAIQQKKLSQINELNASKLTAIQSQMNPHFIFNALNSIQDLILKGDVEHSYSYITTFSNLVRRTLNYSDKDFVEFEQEIKLLELYLSLEKLRFKKSLNYVINAPEISNIMIPPLLIQPFIENALVHGLLHKEGEKQLTISFEFNEALVCTIEDNGIGREKARTIKQRQRSEHESFSGKAIRKRFEILSSVFKGDFHYEYEDLYTGTEPSGTRVKLIIPVKYKF